MLQSDMWETSSFKRLGTHSVESLCSKNIWVSFLQVFLGEDWHLFYYFFETTHTSVYIFTYKLFLQILKSFPFLLKINLILGISNICLVWYKNVKLMFWIFSFSVWVDSLHTSCVMHQIKNYNNKTSELFETKPPFP